MNVDEADNTAVPFESDLSEAEIISRERADAKAALGDSLDALKADLRHAADPRRWARRYPWATVGAALAAGFAVAGAVVPGQGEKLRDKLARSAETLRREPDSSEEGEEKTAIRASLSTLLMTGLFDLAKIGIQMAIRSQLNRHRAAVAAQGEAPREPATDAETATPHPR